MFDLRLNKIHGGSMRLAFYSSLYLGPAILTTLLPSSFLSYSLTLGALCGLWRAFRRGHCEAIQAATYAMSGMALALVVSLVSLVLGIKALPFWCLVAMDQVLRRRKRTTASSSTSWNRRLEKRWIAA